jgi:ribosomal protein S18 acetylase RimI-like enzyme
MTQAKTEFSYQVRVATQAEADDLVRMRLALQAHLARANRHLLALSAQRVAALTNFYLDTLEDPKAQVLVAYDPGAEQVTGMAVGRILRQEEFNPPDWGRIDDVWVEPEYRRRGVCGAMMAQLLEFFARAKIEVLVLEYAVGNREAEQVWSRLGFQPVLTLANAGFEEVKRRLRGSAT